jgi:hypothetical protein
MTKELDPDAALDWEMGNIRYDESCRAPHPDPSRECRRLPDHEPPHASGYGSGRLRWNGPQRWANVIEAVEPDPAAPPAERSTRNRIERNPN